VLFSIIKLKKGAIVLEDKLKQVFLIKTLIKIIQDQESIKNSSFQVINQHLIRLEANIKILNKLIKTFVFFNIALRTRSI
jgi:hypothetical protein